MSVFFFLRKKKQEQGVKIEKDKETLHDDLQEDRAGEFPLEAEGGEVNDVPSVHRNRYCASHFRPSRDKISKEDSYQTPETRSGEREADGFAN